MSLIEYTSPNDQTSQDTVSATPTLSWVDLPEADFGANSIGAFAILPASASSSSISQLYSCTIDAGWTNVTATASFLDGPHLISGEPKNWLLNGKLVPGRPERELKPVSIDIAWAQKLNPVISTDSNTTSFSQLLTNTQLFIHPQNTIDLANVLEAILAVVLIDAMARTASTATVQGTLKGVNQDEAWMSEFLPSHPIFNKGGSAFNLPPSFDRQNATQFRMTVTTNGYAYGPSAATIVSCTILGVYILLALAHVAYTIVFTRLSSSSWDSVAEIVALAWTQGTAIS